ncbi:DMT family transporter [Deltaproteobacteria bacterium OttesenSCG-928-M10]|nr:DMT family transporter [Deltaproteobacteria bacterium OttesenSCG-928-M10]
MIASLLWASGYIVMKWGLDHFHPLCLIALRMLVGGLAFLWAVPWLKGKVKYQAGDWKWFAVMGLGEPCLYFIFEIYALTYTTASQAGTIAAIIPILVALGAFFTLGERMSARSWLGAGLAISGVVWLSLGAEATEAAPNPLWGNFLELCAVICASVYFLCARRLGRHYKPLLITAVQTWIGAVFYLPVLFIPGLGLPAEAPLIAWAGIVYLGLVVSLGAYGSFNFGLSRLNAGNATIYLNLIPVFALLMGVVFLGERLTLQQYPACALVLLGLFISRSN